MSITTALVAALLAVDPPGDLPRISLRPAKVAYCEGEPIGIAINFANPGPGELGLLDDYPTYDLVGDGIVFDAAAAGLAPSPWLKERARPEGAFEIAVDNVTIRPKATWSRVVYLQRFIKQPKPGVYKIPYRLGFALMRPDGAEANRLEQVRGRGVLEITVEPATPRQLKKALDHLDAMFHGSGQDDRDTLEGLCVASEPPAIPYLIKLVKAGKVAEGVEALAHFPEDRRARAAILESRRDGRR